MSAADTSPETSGGPNHTASAARPPLRLGLRENLPQFLLLAATTLGVGLVIGSERVVGPALAASRFHITSFLLTLTFIISFGVVKAALNLVAGRLADRLGRRPLLLLGWLAALPIPFMIIFAQSWWWVVLANVLLGVNQGFAWTITVTSKIDLVGGRSRGFALGVNEFSGYAGVALGGYVGGLLGGFYGPSVAPFVFMLIVSLVFLGVSRFLIRETLPYTRIEQAEVMRARAEAQTEAWEEAASQPSADETPTPLPSLRAIFALTTWGDRTLAAASQAGLVEKFADTLAWGLFPLYFASRGLSLAEIGALVAVYTGVWAVSQLFTGYLTDRIGRKWPIAGGMWLAAAGIALVGLSGGLPGWIGGALLMGVGMALLYPTLLATVSDVARPRWRGSSLGVYRLWRDSGYALGALLIGAIADAFGLLAGFWFAAAIMAASGLVVALLMYETLPSRRRTRLAWEREARFR
ncbi:MAG: MFS transporter [Chloroflexota bacterium]|nr:MFS transporter [Chloroflexota bacterium]